MRDGARKGGYALALALCACGFAETRIDEAPTPATPVSEAASARATEASAPEPPCSRTLDAIFFDCGGGRRFSVRYDPDTYCAWVWVGEDSYVLPQTTPWPNSLNTDGQVELTRGQDHSATLRGVADGPYENCRLVE